MSERKVTLKLTTQKDVIEHSTSARTFGELKKELPSVKWDGMRAVERSTKNTLDHSEALLPAGDFIVFLVPEKVKSGAEVEQIDVESAGYNELRSHASQLNKLKDAQIAMNGGTEDLRKAVKKYYKNVAKSAVGSSESFDPVAEIEEARTKINNAIDVIIENAKHPVADTSSYVVKVSVDDLESEIAEIKKALKL